jgi:hypothetical protein
MCAEGNTAGGVIRESLAGPARSESPGTHDELHAREPGDLVVACEVLVMPVLDGSRGGRPALVGPRGERLGGNPSMHDREKSDRLVVPAKLPNKLGVPGAEVAEGRGLPEGNTASETRPGRSAGQGVSSDLERVRRVARRTGMCGSPRSFTT